MKDKENIVGNFNNIDSMAREIQLTNVIEEI